MQLKNLTILICFLFKLSGFAQSDKPHVAISELKNGEIHKDSLLILSALPINSPFKIVGFTMYYVSPGRGTRALDANGSLFTPQMKKVITNCKAEDYISFESIKYTDNTGKIYLMGPVILKIK